MSEYILEMTNIEKQFPGVKALDKANLMLKKGSVHALMGENGAGKSTMMNMLYGLLQPTSGKILIRGKRSNDEQPDRCHCKWGLEWCTSILPWSHP